MFAELLISYAECILCEVTDVFASNYCGYRLYNGKCPKQDAFSTSYIHHPLTIHNRQHQTECVLGFVSVRQVHHEAGVNFLQDLLLYQHHRFAFPLFDALLFELFAGVHLAGGTYLKESRKNGTD